MTIYRGPGGAGDATNDAIVNQVASYATQAASSADNAANSASTASTSSTNASTAATNAASSASAAAISASNSAASASTSSTAATTATTQANNAASSATAAANSAASASTYASNASTSAATATSKATEAETYAIRAETAETNAETAYSNTLGIFGDAADVANAIASASTSATNAASSATAAASSATAASGSATTAGNYASAALNSANNANAEASEAQSAANTAVAALQSAQAIYGGLDDVTAAVDDAEAFAVQSANSATASSASSSAAQTSANSAATSATNAANSATQAANSAASAAAIVTGVASNRPSIRPSLLLDFANTKQLDPRITFSRPTTATYYDGKTVVKAEENLLTYSEQLNVWSKLNSTVTANATVSPDGNATADEIFEDATNGQHLVISSPVALVLAIYTASVYVKSNARTKLRLNINSSPAACWSDFDLTAVTASAVSYAGSGFSSGTAAITSLGNGWYRCTLTWTSSVLTTGTQYLMLLDATGASSYVGVPTNSIYAWGAQLEQRSTVTAYTPTTSQPITNYIPALQTAAAGVPRFDHNPVTGESKGFLIEEQRTNLVLQSGFASGWVVVNASITQSEIVCPDGTLSGVKAVESTAVGPHAVYRTVSISGATTWSVYAKAGERTRINISAYDGATDSHHVFDLSNGTIVSNQTGTASISAVGNGWYRCSVTRTGTSASAQFALYLVNTGTNISYTGDGYSGIYIWGAQLEAGSFPTSYIPTVASQVTRSADSASMTGSNFSSWYRADEGSLYAEAALLGGVNGISYTAAYISDGTTINKTSLFAYNNGTGSYPSFEVAISAVNQASLSAVNSVATYVPFKSVGSYARNNFAFSKDGAAVLTDTSGNIPTNQNAMFIGLRAGNADYLNGTIKRIAFWPKRLSNSELQGLTS